MIFSSSKESLKFDYNKYNEDNEQLAICLSDTRDHMVTLIIFTICTRPPVYLPSD